MTILLNRQDEKVISYRKGVDMVNERSSFIQ